MDVVELDMVVVGMLNDELARCRKALDALNSTLSEFPRGSLRVRIKRRGRKEYRYHCLKFRDGARVVNQHVPSDAVKELQDKLALRKRYASEAKAHEKRISYIDGILGKKAKDNEDQNDLSAQK